MELNFLTNILLLLILSFYLEALTKLKVREKRKQSNKELVDVGVLFLADMLNSRCCCSKVKRSKLLTVLVKRQSAETTPTEKVAVEHRTFYFSVYLHFSFSSTKPDIY